MLNHRSWLHACLFTFINTGCGGYYRSKEGTLHSPKYLGDGDTGYPNDAKCGYWIEQPVGTRIKLEFLNFNTELCCDYLQVHYNDISIL